MRTRGVRVRRRLAVLLLVLGSIAPAPAGAGAFEPAVDGMTFTVLRDGTEIGQHRLRFRRDGADLIVEIDTDLRVWLAGVVPVFRFQHEGREVWRNGQLIAIDTRTNDDGAQDFVRGRAIGEGFAIESAEKRGLMKPDVLPTSYWNRSLVERRKVDLLNSQNGRTLSVEIQPAGDELVEAAGMLVWAQRFLIRGDLDQEIWFDGDGIWVMGRFRAFDGSLIEYRRM